MIDLSDHPTVFHRLSILNAKLQGCLIKPYKSFLFCHKHIFHHYLKPVFHKLDRLVYFNWANENRKLCVASCVMGI